MPLAPVNGIDLYYESHGSSEDVIVFAHGGTGNHLSWFQQVPHFQDRYRCVVFDHRGFGQSVDAPDGPGGSAYAEDLRGLMDHLGIERAFLVGQSMGTRTVMGFAMAYPERVRGLVIAASTGTIVDPEIRRMREENNPAGQPPPTADTMYSERFKEQEPTLMFLFRSFGALNPPREQTYAASLHPMEERYMATPERLAEFPAPVLFIAGESDRIATPPIVARAASLVPGAVRHEIPVASHCAVLEDAATWNRLVDEFLESIADR